MPPKQGARLVWVVAASSGAEGRDVFADSVTVFFTSELGLVDCVTNFGGVSADAGHDEKDHQQNCDYKHCKGQQAGTVSHHHVSQAAILPELPKIASDPAALHKQSK